VPVDYRASTGPCAISPTAPFAYGDHQRPRATGSASVWISALGGFPTSIRLRVPIGVSATRRTPRAAPSPAGTAAIPHPE